MPVASSWLLPVGRLGALAVNNLYLHGIRGEGRSATHRAMALMEAGRFDASLVHTHTFPREELPEALRHARERIDDAIKVVLSMQPGVIAGAKGDNS